jgi:hypothetical protein
MLTALHWLLVHTLLAQSVLEEQALLVAHVLPLATQGPPQSVSVSSWFLTPSLHVGCEKS